MSAPRYVYAYGTNGLRRYHSEADSPGAESSTERQNRERYWRSLRKLVEKGRRI